MLRRRLAETRPLIALNPGGPSLAAIDAARHGADALFIDCERTQTGLHEAAWMTRAARAAGLATLVRAENAATSTIVRHLDLGPDGLVVPAVEDSATVARLVRLVADHRPEPAALLVVQIETVAGHEAVDDICASPGVGAILIGPNDLAASMGLPGQPDAPEVAAAVRDIATRVARSGLPFGLPVNADTAPVWRDRGARLFYTTLEQMVGIGLAAFREGVAA